MPRIKKVCPFTDKPCNDCRALFAEESHTRSGEKTRGCHLAEKTETDNNK